MGDLVVSVLGLAFVLLILYMAIILPGYMVWQQNRVDPEVEARRVQRQIEYAKRAEAERERRRGIHAAHGVAVAPAATLETDPQSSSFDFGLTADLDGRIESPAEQALWDAYRRSPDTKRVVDLIPQYEVLGYRLDFADPELRLCVEVDGLAYHNGQEAFIRDQRRQRQLAAAGWTVLRFAAKETLGEPGMCLAEIRKTAGRISR